jgi:hypothetical protein
MGKNLTILILCICLISCSPRPFKPYDTPNIIFDKVPPYSIDLENITKPEKIQSIYVDENFKEVPPEKAKYILLVPKEYSKIPALLRLCQEYKDIIKEQEKLINIGIDKENALHEFIVLEQQKKDKYKELWAISEDSYRQEKYYNSIDKYSMYLIVGGMVVALIVGL